MNTVAGLIIELADRLPIPQTSMVSIGLIVLSVLLEQQDGGIDPAAYWPWVAVVALVLVVLAVLGQVIAYLLNEIEELKEDRETIRSKYDAVIQEKNVELKTKQEMIDQLLRS